MFEVADIFREAGQAYRGRFAARMLPSHLRAMRDIERCRTAALGGHLRQCDDCGALQYSYHSCRNRHCPKCHGDQTRRRLEQQRARVLPCSYFLLTFTLPAQLRDLARAHQKVVYGILMRAAAQSLLKLTADLRYLGARPGIIAVLHTWTRAMLYHPHAHLLVTAGGLTGDGRIWRYPTRPEFLVPGHALSVIFRASTLATARTSSTISRAIFSALLSPTAASNTLMATMLLSATAITAPVFSSAADCRHRSSSGVSCSTSYPAAWPKCAPMACTAPLVALLSITPDPCSRRNSPTSRRITTTMPYVMSQPTTPSAHAGITSVPVVAAAP